jgi:ectoine hydroxylase-related dioxygenase (phytanoyl-CoA dioxygenase family)
MVRVHASECSVDEFDQAIARDGWIILEGALDSQLRARICDELTAAYQVNRDVQLRNGVGEGTDGAVHHLPCQGGAFIELLEKNPCAPFLQRFFGGAYILNTFGGVLNLPGKLSYVGGVHRDIRSFGGDLRLMGQMLVMLDDFTEANGATYMLTGSHTSPVRPDDAEFFAHAERAVAPAGSIVMFDSNLWHAAGANSTGESRRALTLAFTRPFMKQQLDYPRALGWEAVNAMSPALRQVLGYNARVPSSLDEWYQPPDRRFYKRDQG